MSQLGRYAELLKKINLEKGIGVGERTFVGPEEVMKEIGVLEDLYRSLKEVDILQLYKESIAHDGLHEEDINRSGRYYAYLLFELKGQSSEEKKEILAKSLTQQVENLGKNNILKYFPGFIKGRQVTEDLHIRPENEDYPSNYSRVRIEYARKMAKDEVPNSVLDKIRDDQDKILDQYDWYTIYVTNSKGTLLEICGNVYLVSSEEGEEIKSYAGVWNTLMEKGVDTFYNFTIATDGDYPEDAHTTIGRYYAYTKFELQGLSEEGRGLFLTDALPERAVKKLGIKELTEIFPAKLNGDPVTQPLTIRPEEDEYPSHFNKRKIERGKKNGYKQILYNIQAEIISRVDEKLREIKKIIILREPEQE